MFRDLAMGPGRVRTEFAHGAEHCNALTPAADIAQQRQRRARGARVRVVRVVEQERRAHRLHRRAHRRGRHRGDALRGRRRGDTELTGDRQSERGVVQVVPTAERHLHPHPLMLEPTASILMQRMRAERAGDHAPRAPRGLRDHRRVRRRHHCDRDSVAERHLLGHHALETAEPLKMLLLHRRHDRDIGTNDLAQDLDLAGLVRAALHHRELGAVFKREQGEWHADPVVEVPGGRMHLVGAAERRTQQLLGTRLSVRAADGDHGSPPGQTAVARQRAECHQRVGDLEDRNAE